MGWIGNVFGSWTGKKSGGASKRSLAAVNLTDANAFWKAMGVEMGNVVVTNETALGMTALYRCVDLISNTIATPTFKVYERLPSGDRTEAPDHQVHPIISFRPNRHMSSFVWRKAMMVHVCIYGNGVSEVIRDQSNRVLEIKLLKPADYTFLETDNRLMVQTKDGRILSEENYIHWKDLCIDGKIGLSKIGLTNKSIKTQMLAEEFLSKYYANGTFTNGFLKIPTKASDDILDAITQRWDDTYGGVGNAFKTPILQLGTEYQSITKSNVESQLMEFLNLAPTKIYQTFGIPPHLASDMTKSTSFGKGIEDLSILYLTYTAMPFAVQFEQECVYKLFRQSEWGKYYVKLNLKTFQRADFVSESEGFAKMVNAGIYSPDDVLKLMDMNGYKGGDIHMVNGNMIAVENVKNNIVGRQQQTEGRDGGE